MGAADQGMFLQYCVFDGSISSNNSDIQRRPYHRNCGCALHQSRGVCAHSLHRPSSNVSYPIRRSWSEGTLSLALSPSNTNTLYSCYCSSNNGDNHSLSSSSASPSSPASNYSIN